VTFLDIYQDVARRCDKNPSAPDPETNTRIRTFINDRYRELMRIPGVMNLRDEVFGNNYADSPAFRSVPGENRVVLPATITAITDILDTTNRIKLQLRTLDWIRERDSSQPGVSTGTPTCYAILNNAGTTDALPINGVAIGQLVVVSDHPQDIGGVVTLEYQDEYGAFRAQQATLNGETVNVMVALARTVFRMSVDSPQLGRITLKEMASGNVLITIPPNTITAQTSNLHTSRGWTIWLWPTPSGAFDYNVDGTRPRAALVNEMDEPALPEDFHTLLVWGACEDEMLHMDDTRMGVFSERWRRDVAALKGYLHQVRGQRLIPEGGRQRPGWSPLGSNYPPWT